MMIMNTKAITITVLIVLLAIVGCEDFLDKPILMVPIANHDDLQHAPDENLRIWNLWYGIDFYAQLFTMPGG